jgi:hypothetical protein
VVGLTSAGAAQVKPAVAVPDDVGDRVGDGVVDGTVDGIVDGVVDGLGVVIGVKLGVVIGLKLGVVIGVKLGVTRGPDAVAELIARGEPSVVGDGLTDVFGDVDVLGDGEVTPCDASAACASWAAAMIVARSAPTRSVGPLDEAAKAAALDEPITRPATNPASSRPCGPTLLR